MLSLINKAVNKYNSWWSKKDLSEQVIIIALVPIIYGIWLLVKTW